MQLTRVVSRQPATYNYLVRDLVKPNENIGTTGLHDLLSTAPFKRPILPFEPDEMAYAKEAFTAHVRRSSPLNTAGDAPSQASESGRLAGACVRVPRVVRALSHHSAFFNLSFSARQH